MMKKKALERLMRFLITLLGVGIGAGIATLAYPFLQRVYPVFEHTYMLMLLYVGLCTIGAALGFLLSCSIIQNTMHLVAVVERSWERMPFPQIVLSTIGLILGLLVAFFATQVVLSAGPSLITISFSALIYLVLGMLGMRIGFRRYKEGGRLDQSLRRWNRSGRTSLTDVEEMFADIAGEPDKASAASPKKLLDTSVIIDGRILDIARTGFLEGELVIAGFVLTELRHIADSGDSLRRARGRRGLDVLGKLQKELSHSVIVDDTDYDDIEEVDVKLLRLCRDLDGVVVTNDYNLNKVAGVAGLKVLNINDLANAVKSKLMAGEELTVQVVREGREPGQGVAYLDDGTMIVVDGGRRHVGEEMVVVVNSVLQTSAGRMIFTRIKSEDGDGDGQGFRP